jgi:hypothetical protein
MGADLCGGIVGIVINFRDFLCFGKSCFHKLSPNWEISRLLSRDSECVFRWKVFNRYRHGISVLVHKGVLLVDIYTAKCDADLHFNAVINPGGEGAQSQRSRCEILRGILRGSAIIGLLKDYTVEIGADFLGSIKFIEKRFIFFNRQASVPLEMYH